MGAKVTIWTALLLVVVLVTFPSVGGFHRAVPAVVRRSRNMIADSAAPRDARRNRLEATSTDLGGILGDKVASAIVGSPFYPLLTKQAKNTMKQSAKVSMICHVLRTCPTGIQRERYTRH